MTDREGYLYDSEPKQRRTRKELKAEIRRLQVALKEEQQKFSVVNDRCGKTLQAINEARDVLNSWRERGGA